MQFTKKFRSFFNTPLENLRKRQTEDCLILNREQSTDIAFNLFFRTTSPPNSLSTDLRPYSPSSSTQHEK